MKKLPLVLSALSFVSVMAFASPLLQVNMGDYDAYTSDQEIAKALESDPCARAALNSVKENVLNEIAMDNGVDIPEAVDVTFLKAIDLAPFGKATYSVSVGAGEGMISRLVETSRAGKKCTAGKPYTAAL